MNLKPLDWPDLPALALEWEANSSRVLKRDLVKQGYDKIMSLYGALRIVETGELIGIRIELLSKTPYDTPGISFIYNYFNHNRYPLKYCIWTYDPEGPGLTLRGVYP
jgi:hypothetical protein